MPTTTKADTVSADILRKIVRGELETGALLPKAEILAEDYGVNRGVVREALKSLEVQNLVQPRKRRGTEVLDPTTSFSAEVMSAMLLPEADSARIDLDALRDFLEIRAVLDTQMATLAASNRTDADVASLEACLADVEAAQDDVQRYSDAITRLSLAVATATGNRIFPMLVHWHARVQVELQDLLLTVRQPGTAHLQGITYLIQLIIGQNTDAIARLLEHFHAWAIPQLLDAAVQRNGECS